MSETKKEDPMLLKNYLSKLLFSAGIFWIITGVLLFLISFLLTTFIYIEYLVTFGIPSFLIYIFYYIAIFMVVIGILHFFERAFLNSGKPIARLLGIFLGLLQIWIFPIGTFLGYLIFQETRNFST